MSQGAPVGDLAGMLAGMAPVLDARRWAFALVEGALGVPIALSGPLQKPKVSVPPGFYAGAAIGTVLLPGIGTAIGARIGGAIGEVFSGDGKNATK